MLVVVFLGLLAVALSYPLNFISQVFELPDFNKDGVLTISEWFARYSNADVNGDELLTLVEYAAAVHPGSPPREVEDIFKIVDKLDGKKDGLLYPSSAAVFFNSMGGKNDGKITPDELEATFSLLFDGGIQLLA